MHAFIGFCGLVQAILPVVEADGHGHCKHLLGGESLIVRSWQHEVA